jgi:hypothetical protein
MEKSDYPVVMFREERLLVVPEFPEVDSEVPGREYPKCKGCIANPLGEEKFNRELCDPLARHFQQTPFYCSGVGEPSVYIRESEWEAYVTELVIRRLDS